MYHKIISGKLHFSGLFSIIAGMEESIFTKIINRQRPANIVFEDDQVIAFLDIAPRSRGHTLVVPKKQIDQLDDVDDQLYSHLMAVVHKLSQKIRKDLNPKRVGVLVYGLDVAHAHIHLIPLYSGEEMSFAIPSQPASSNQLREVLNIIKTDQLD